MDPLLVGKDLIKINQVFPNYEDFEKSLHTLQKEMRQTFVKYDSKLLSSSNIKNANKACVYEKLILRCIHGPLKIRSQSKKQESQRETRTRKLNCGAFIKLVLSKNKQNLIILDINLHHTNHDGSEEFFEHNSINRRLNEEEIKVVLEMHQNGVKVSRIAEKILNDYKKIVTSHDLQNYIQRVKNDDADQLSTFIKILKEYDANVSVIFEHKDDKDMFKALYFSTFEMRKILLAWPEIIFMDTTYNLFKKRLILLLLMIQDSNGFSHIVGVGVLLNEQASTLKGFLEEFKKDNEEACSKIKCFMTDKDLTERGTISEVFPSVYKLLCEFHVLKIFSRAIKIETMKCTSAQRDSALDYLDKLTKSNSEEKYNHLYKEFCASAPEKVIEYFNKNWHENCQEWTRFGMSNKNFGSYTNNPVESENAKLKSDIGVRRTLKDFAHGFFRHYNRRNLNIKHKLQENIFKQPLFQFQIGSVEDLYCKLLTPFAFKKVLEQYERHYPMTFLTILNNVKACFIRCGFAVIRACLSSCECNDFKSNNLPCRHIFAVRRHFQKPLFDPSLCDARWTNEHNLLGQPTLEALSTAVTKSVSKLSINSRSSPSRIPVYIEQKSISRINPGFSERRKMMTEIGNNLIYLASLCTKDKFNVKYQLFKNIEKAWIAGVDLQIDESCMTFMRHSSDVEKERFQLPPNIKITGKPSGVLKSTIPISTKSKRRQSNVT